MNSSDENKAEVELHVSLFLQGMVAHSSQPGAHKAK